MSTHAPLYSFPDGKVLAGCEKKLGLLLLVNLNCTKQIVIFIAWNNFTVLPIFFSRRHLDGKQGIIGVITRFTPLQNNLSLMSVLPIITLIIYIPSHHITKKFEKHCLNV
jgi:hypothetical protein